MTGWLAYTVAAATLSSSMLITGTSGTAVPHEYIYGLASHASVADAANMRNALQGIGDVEPLDSIGSMLVRFHEGHDPKAGGDPRLVLPAGLRDDVAWVQPNLLHQLRDVPAAASAPAAPHTPAPVGPPAPASASAKTPGTDVLLAAPSNDPMVGRQYHLRNDGSNGGVQGADLGAADAWRTSTGKGVIVALVDTNIDVTHPDLASKVWTNPGEIAGNHVDDDHNGYVDDVHGWNFGKNDNDPADGGDDHGTHTAGIIGAATNNAIGVAGVAPDAQVMPLAILTGGATTANAVKAFDYAVRNGASIISNSWGNNTYEPALAAAVKQATDAGAMVVVAAGNESWDTGVHGSYPDNYAGSVSVAASTATDARASYSNRGTTTIDVAAPGDKVFSTVPGGRYEEMSGTSMAAPGYAGVAALVKSAYPQLTMQQVEQRIFRSVDRSGSAAGWNGLVASGGRIDAARALTPLAEPGAPTPTGFSRSSPGGMYLPLPDGVASPFPGGMDVAAPTGRRLLPRPGVGPVTRPIVLAGVPVKVGWSTDLPAGNQRYVVEATTNADAVSHVAETFEGGAASRPFHTDGDLQWTIRDGIAHDGTGAMVASGLRRDEQARLQLTETLPGSENVSFWYRGGGRGGQLSFFVDRNLQFQPTADDAWHQFSAQLPAGEHTMTWLATGAGSGAQPVAIDGLTIDSVSDARWQSLGTTAPDQTTIGWQPATTTSSAQLRVRADNGVFQGDWVTGPQFEVR